MRPSGKQKTDRVGIYSYEQRSDEYNEQAKIEAKIIHCAFKMINIKYALFYCCVIITIRSCQSEGLCNDLTRPVNCTDDHCLYLVTNTTYRQILYDEIRFLKILLQRLTSAGLTTIKPEHLNRTLLLASSQEVETGTLEFTRLHLLNAILENPAARIELEYVYVSRQDGFPRIVSEVRNKMKRFEEKVRLETSGGGGSGSNNWELLQKLFDRCKKGEAIDENYARAEIGGFMNFERWHLLAINFNEDYKTGKFCGP